MANEEHKERARMILAARFVCNVPGSKAHRIHTAGQMLHFGPLGIFNVT